MSTYTAERLIEEFGHGVEKLSGPVTRRAQQALDAWAAGKIDTDTLTDLLVTVLETSNAYARHLGDLIATRAVNLLDDRYTRPTGKITIDPHQERQRLALAVATLLADVDTADGIRARLQRLTDAEPGHAMQQQMINTYSQHGTPGYTRGLNRGACQLCRWLYRDGHVWPVDKPFHQHPGCGCSPIPTSGKVRNRL